jgi:hypothetical protein
LVEAFEVSKQQQIALVFYQKMCSAAFEAHATNKKCFFTSFPAISVPRAKKEEKANDNNDNDDDDYDDQQINEATVQIEMEEIPSHQVASNLWSRCCKQHLDAPQDVFVMSERLPNPLRSVFGKLKNMLHHKIASDIAFDIYSASQSCATQSWFERDLFKIISKMLPWDKLYAQYAVGFDVKTRAEAIKTDVVDFFKFLWEVKKTRGWSWACEDFLHLRCGNETKTRTKLTDHFAPPIRARK